MFNFENVLIIMYAKPFLQREADKNSEKCFCGVIILSQLCQYDTYRVTPALFQGLRPERMEKRGFAY